MLTLHGATALLSSQSSTVLHNRHMLASKHGKHAKVVSDTESEAKLRRSSHKKDGKVTNYKNLHEGRKQLSPVREDSVSDPDGEVSVTEGDRLPSEHEHDELVEGSGDDLAGHTPHSSDEVELDQQIQCQKESLKKIERIKEESRKRIDNLERLLSENEELKKE